jgi:multicomponent Na+:H+ antiporter subunit E
MRIKSFIIIFSLLFVIWLILNSSLSLEYLISGLVISALISLFFCRECSVLNDFRFTPKAFIYTFMFLVVFLAELFKSNFDIAWRVLSPSLPINPGIIKTKTVLKSKMARLILANSITLTPGTFTIDIIEDELFIHCVNIKEDDLEAYGHEIVRKFEKYLEVIYG